MEPHPNQDILASMKKFQTLFSDLSIQPPVCDLDPMFEAIRSVDVLIASYTLNAFKAGETPDQDFVVYAGFTDVGAAIFLSRIYFLRRFVELRMALNSLPNGSDSYYHLALSEQMDQTRTVLGYFDEEEYDVVIEELEAERSRVLQSWKGPNSRDKEIDKAQLAAAYGLLGIINSLRVTQLQNGPEGN